MSEARVELEGAALLCGDCLEYLPELRAERRKYFDADPDESGHLVHIITDPPYSDRTHRGHDAASSTTGRRELGYGALTPADVWTIADAFTACADGWIVWMTDHVLAPVIEKELTGAKRYTFAPLPYFAPGSRVRLQGDGPSNWTIWIVVARTRALAKWGTLPGGYVQQPGPRDPGRVGGARMGGKPLSLMRQIVRDYTRPGDLVIDPFMGGGTTGVAALEQGRRFIGIETDRDVFDQAVERIADSQRQGALFA